MTNPKISTLGKASPKIETVETPESSPNDMALAAAAASVAASNDYFFDPFSAAAQAAAVSQSSLPTPGKSK